METIGKPEEMNASAGKLPPKIAFSLALTSYIVRSIHAPQRRKAWLITFRAV